jgi:hypothetical protein
LRGQSGTFTLFSFNPTAEGGLGTRCSRFGHHGANAATTEADCSAKKYDGKQMWKTGGCLPLRLGGRATQAKKGRRSKNPSCSANSRSTLPPVLSR